MLWMRPPDETWVPSVRSLWLRVVVEGGIVGATVGAVIGRQSTLTASHPHVHHTPELTKRSVVRLELPTDAHALESRAAPEVSAQRQPEGPPRQEPLQCGRQNCGVKTLYGKYGFFPGQRTLPRGFNGSAGSSGAGSGAPS